MYARKLMLSAVGVAAVGAAVIGVQATAHAAVRPAVTHTCTAQIVPFEDGSFIGSTLTYDGTVVSKEWDLHLPQIGWKPAWLGTPCIFIISTQDGGRG